MGFSPSDHILDSMREFAIYTVDSRNIPYVADGLKNVQRISLWLLRHRAEKMKTYSLAGLLGYEKLYVHGEKSATDAISKLAAPYLNNVPLIEGLGAFGSRVAPVEGIGSPRYTDVRRAKAAEAFLYVDLDIVPLKPNYDGSTMQPAHMLPLVPIVLLNGVSGTATGWSTKILPRSLKSLIDATLAVLDGKPVPTLIPYYHRYNIDVRPTGAPNQWEFSGRCAVIDNSTLQIRELPPGIAIEAFRKRLNTMEESDHIQSYADRSTDAINITVRMKRGECKGWTEIQALDFFKLRDRETERVVVIDWNGRSIRQYETSEQLVEAFVAWRLTWYAKRYEKFCADDMYELMYWQALKILFESGFTQRLGHFSDRAAMAENVATTLAARGLALDAPLMDRLLSLATYRWTQAFEAEINAKIKSLQAAITEHRAIIADPTRQKAVYRAELNGLKALQVA